MICQNRYILGRLAQGWCLNIDDAQSVIEICAKLFFSHGGFQVAVGRGDDAHVDRHRRAAADAVDGAFLQHPKDLRLCRETQIADFVEEQRALVGGFEFADTSIDAGRDAFLNAE